MGWCEDLEAALPPPHRDDPGSVRRDILDEIADHLQSSVERELTTGADAAEARRRALHRFGDPQQIAGQLFLEAVKEKAMSQRLTLVLVILLCVISMGGTYLMWRTAEQGQQATAALIARLDDLTKQPPANEPPQYMDWIPVTVKLIDEQGQPVANPDYKVTLRGNIIKDGERASIDNHPDSNGVCDFGIIRPGMIELLIDSPWDERAHTTSLVRPGTPFERQLTVPAHDRKLVEQKIAVDWPEDLANKPLWTHLVFAYDDRETGGMEWSHDGRELTTTYYANLYKNLSAEDFTSPHIRDHDILPNGVSILISPQGKIIAGELVPKQLTFQIPFELMPGPMQAYGAPSEHKLYAADFSGFLKNKLWRKNQTSTAARWYLSEFPRVQFRPHSNSENPPDRMTVPLPRDSFRLIAVSVVLGNAADVVGDGSSEKSLGRVALFRTDANRLSGEQRGELGLSPADVRQMFSRDADKQLWRFSLTDQQLGVLRQNIPLIKELLAAADDADSNENATTR